MPTPTSERSDLIGEIMRSTEFTRDALPYTGEFDRLHAEYQAASSRVIKAHEFWRLLSNVAKRGGWKGKRRGERAPDLTHQQWDTLRSHFAGRLGRRDGLPYTEVFDDHLAAFKAATGLNLSHRQLWRALCNAGKESLRADVAALLQQGIGSLLLAVEHFNRPSEVGRQASVLMMLDHACEMLLKAALLQRGTAVRRGDSGHAHSLGFCANKATDDSEIQFLSDDERRTLMVLNGLRDQAQHYLVDVSEHVLYTVAQGTVTLFSELLRRLFGKTLAEHFPERVLPISTSPPRDIELLMDEELTQLRRLLDCGQGERVKAETRLRSLVTIDRALKREGIPVPDGEFESIKTAIRQTTDWRAVFKGISQFRLTTDGAGVDVSVRLTKKEGIPMRVVRDGDFPEGVIAIRNDTSFYCYSAKELARRVRITLPRMVALIRYLELAQQPDCFKEITIGRSRFKMYSGNALSRLRLALPNVDMDEVWREHGPRRKRSR